MSLSLRLLFASLIALPAFAERLPLSAEQRDRLRACWAAMRRVAPEEKRELLGVGAEGAAGRTVPRDGTPGWVYKLFSRDEAPNVAILHLLKPVAAEPDQQIHIAQFEPTSEPSLYRYPDPQGKVVSDFKDDPAVMGKFITAVNRFHDKLRAQYDIEVAEPMRMETVSVAGQSITGPVGGLIVFRDRGVPPRTGTLSFKPENVAYNESTGIFTVFDPR